MCRGSALEAMVDSTGATRDLAPSAQEFFNPRDTTVLAPDKVNDDTPCRDTEETLSATTPDAFCIATVYYKYVCYRGRWQESVAYIGGVGRRA